MSEYRPRDGSQLSKEEAKTYGQRIEQLTTKGYVTPEKIVDDAKNEKSPLHSFFEWDDSAAAAQYRLDQARFLLRSIMIIPGKEIKTPVRAFYCVHASDVPASLPDNEKSISTDPASRVVYATIKKVFNDADLSQQVVDQALSELKSWQNRYRQYKQLASLNNIIDVEVAKMTKQEVKA